MFAAQGTAATMGAQPKKPQGNFADLLTALQALLTVLTTQNDPGVLNRLATAAGLNDPQKARQEAVEGARVQVTAYTSNLCFVDYDAFQLVPELQAILLFLADLETENRQNLFDMGIPYPTEKLEQTIAKFKGYATKMSDKYIDAEAMAVAFDDAAGLQKTLWFFLQVHGTFPPADGTPLTAYQTERYTAFFRNSTLPLPSNVRTNLIRTLKTTGSLAALRLPQSPTITQMVQGLFAVYRKVYAALKAQQNILPANINLFEDDAQDLSDEDVGTVPSSFFQQTPRQTNTSAATRMFATAPPTQSLFNPRNTAATRLPSAAAANPSGGLPRNEDLSPTLADSDNDDDFGDFAGAASTSASLPNPLNDDSDDGEPSAPPMDKEPPAFDSSMDKPPAYGTETGMDKPPAYEVAVVAPPDLSSELRVSSDKPNGTDVAVHNSTSLQDSTHYLLQFVPTLKDLAATKPNGQVATSIASGFIHNTFVSQALRRLLGQDDVDTDFVDAEVLQFLEKATQLNKPLAYSASVVVAKQSADQKLLWSDIASLPGDFAALMNPQSALYTFVEAMTLNDKRLLFTADVLHGDQFHLATQTIAKARKQDVVETGFNNCFMCMRALLMEQPDDLPYTRQRNLCSYSKKPRTTNIHHRRTRAQRMTYRPFLYSPYTLQFLRMNTALSRSSRIQLMLCVLYNVAKTLQYLEQQVASLEPAVYKREKQALQVIYAAGLRIIQELASRQNAGDAKKVNAALVDDMYRTIILVLYMSHSVLIELYAEMKLVSETPGVLTGVTLYGVYVSAILMYNHRWRPQLQDSKLTSKYDIGAYPRDVSKKKMETTVAEIFGAIQKFFQ